VSAYLEDRCSATCGVESSTVCGDPINGCTGDAACAGTIQWGEVTTGTTDICCAGGCGAVDCDAYDSTFEPSQYVEAEVTAASCVSGCDISDPDGCCEKQTAVCNQANLALSVSNIITNHEDLPDYCCVKDFSDYRFEADPSSVLEICDRRDNDCDCPGDTDGDLNRCDEGDAGVDEGLSCACYLGDVFDTPKPYGVCEGLTKECIIDGITGAGIEPIFTDVDHFIYDSNYEPVESNCFDGLDNDCDDKTDYEDEDCPLAWWRFDDDVTDLQADDSSGNNFHGTIVGDVQYVTGIRNNAYEFNDDYVQTQLDFANLGTSFSFEGWINNGNSADTQTYIVGCQDSTDYFIGKTNLPDRLAISMTGIVTGWQPANSDIFDGEWHHFAFVKDGSTMTAYIDGVYADSTTVNDVSPPIAKILRIGGAWYDWNWRGMVDELKVYNKALSADDVVDDFTAPFDSCDGSVPDYRNCEKQLGVCQGSKDICDSTFNVFFTCIAADYDAYAQTNFGVPYEETESSCSDGEDNDCDGYEDYDDTDCKPYLWYKFDDSVSDHQADDSSGNNLHGTIYGSVEDADGKINSAYLFVNPLPDAYVESPVSTSDLGSDFSLEVWMNSNNVKDDSSTLFGVGNSVNWKFGKRGIYNQMHVKMNGITITDWYPDDSAVFDGKWHHIVLVKEGDQMTLYKDGLFADSIDVNPGETSIVDTVRVGNSWYSWQYRGLLDEAIIWRRPLSGAEVLDRFELAHIS